MPLHECSFLLRSKGYFPELKCNDFTQILPTCGGAFLWHDPWFCRIDILLKHRPSVILPRSQRIDQAVTGGGRIQCALCDLLEKILKLFV